MMVNKEPYMFCAHGVAYLVGIRWRLMLDKKSLARTLKDAPLYYVLDHHLAPRCAVIPPEGAHAYSLALTVARAPGVLPDAVIAWHVGDYYGCIGLKDQLPLPGFDVVCPAEDVVFYVRLFLKMLQQRAAVYANDDELYRVLSTQIDHVVLVDLSATLDAPLVSALPRRRRYHQRSIWLAGLLILGVVWAAHWFVFDRSTQVRRSMAVSIQKTPLKDWTEAAGPSLFSAIEQYIFSFPIDIGGWRLSQIHCASRHCVLSYEQQFSDVQHFQKAYHASYAYAYDLSHRVMHIQVHVPSVSLLTPAVLRSPQATVSDLSQLANEWLACHMHVHMGILRRLGDRYVATYELSGAGIFFPYVHLLKAMTLDTLIFNHDQGSDRFVIRGKIYARSVA